MRTREIHDYVKSVAGLVLEMQELWLQTRIQSPFEVRLIRDMSTLKEGWQKTLTILEWKRSVMRNLVLSVSRRINLFGLGERDTRREISSFWQRTYASFKHGQWHRISLHRLPGNLFREAKIGLHFILSALYQARPRYPMGRHKRRKLAKPLVVSLSLPGRMREIRDTLEAFLGELGVQVVSAGHSLEGLLEKSHEGVHGHVHEAEELVLSYLWELKGKADYVLLPVLEDVDHYHERFLASVERLATRSMKNLPNIIHVPLSRLDTVDLQESLHQLGLLFTDDVLRVQSACEKALSIRILQYA
jgi:hypothetical protein